MKACYRVNYYEGGQSKTAYVCAPSEGEASAFLGVRDGSASVSAVAAPVEIVGVDHPHAALIPPAINYAPPEAPAQVSRQEYEALKQKLEDLHRKMSGQGVPVKS